MPLMVADTSTAMPYIKSGKLLPLMTFAAKRLPQLPGVPTAREAGFNEVEAYAWQGLVVSSATPESIRERLSREMQKALSNPGVRKKLQDAGWEANPSDPQLLAAYTAVEKAKWQKLIRDRGITAE